MGLKTITKTIADADGEDVEYVVVQMKAMNALRLLPRLNKMLGPVLGKLAKMKAGADPTGTDLDAIAEALGVVGEYVTEDALSLVTRELLWNTKRAGKPLFKADGSSANFDLDMAGDMYAVFKLIWVALELNFGDFLAAARATKSKLVAATASPPASPPPSEG